MGIPMLCEDNSKTNLTEIGCEDENWIEPVTVVYSGMHPCSNDLGCEICWQITSVLRANVVHQQQVQIRHPVRRDGDANNNNNIVLFP